MSVEAKDPLNLPEYAVCVTNDEELTTTSHSSTIYLRSASCAQFLQPFFDTLYRSHGISISPYDDEIVFGENIDRLAETIAEATFSAKAQPATWDVVIGYEHLPHQKSLGDPIIETATRDELVIFLKGVGEKIIEAKRCAGYVHFCVSM